MALQPIQPAEAPDASPDASNGLSLVERGTAPDGASLAGAAGA